MSNVIPEKGHIVQLITPQDLAAASSSEVFSMSNYQHADIIILKGAGSAATITVEECDDFVPTTVDLIPFNYRTETTTVGDTLSVSAAAGTGGVAISATTTTMLIISIDADELDDGYPCLRIRNDATGSTLLGVVAVLSNSRYQGAITPTAII